MNQWSFIDNLVADQSIFFKVDSKQYQCDACHNSCTFPFYNFLAYSASNTVDLCTRCYKNGIQITTRRISRYIRCIFCKRQTRGFYSFKIAKSEVVLFSCASCDPATKLERKLLLITAHHITVRRRQPLFLDFQPARPRLPLFSKDACAIDVQMWAALVEDLIFISDDFGPIRDWYVFADYKLFCALSNERVYFLENTADGRIGACVINASCHARAYVVFNSRAEYEIAVARAAQVMRQYTRTQFNSNIYSLYHLYVKHEYLSVLKNYIGFLQPGLCNLVDMLLKRNFHP